jgi:hypothetical protein
VKKIGTKLLNRRESNDGQVDGLRYWFDADYVGLVQREFHDGIEPSRLARTSEVSMDLFPRHIVGERKHINGVLMEYTKCGQYYTWVPVY